MNKKQAIAIAKPLFKHYPGTNDFYITSDGEAFFTENDAFHHGKSLGDVDQPFISVNIDDKDEEKTSAKLVKKIVTQEDLDANPELAVKGIKVGDEIEIPAPPKPAASETKPPKTAAPPKPAAVKK